MALRQDLGRGAEKDQSRGLVALSSEFIRVFGYLSARYVTGNVGVYSLNLTKTDADSGGEDYLLLDLLALDFRIPIVASTTL